MKGFEEITNKNYLTNIIINKKIKLMKRNFLLMLLLTLLPFAGWAQSVTLTGVKNAPEGPIWVIGSTSLPGASTGTVDAFFDANSNPVTEITEVGWYFAKVGENFIAFQAAKAGTYEIIKDESSFNASYGGTGTSYTAGAGPGVLVPYYVKNPTEDLWNGNAATFNDKVCTFKSFNKNGTDWIALCDGTAKMTWVSETAAQATVQTNTPSTESAVTTEVANTWLNQSYYITMAAQVGDGEYYQLYTDQALTAGTGVYVKITDQSYPGFTHCWDGAIHAPGALYPHVNVDCRQTVTTDGYRVALVYGDAVVEPWGTTLFGNGTGQKAWGMESLPGAFGTNVISKIDITANPATESNFNVANFSALLLPESATAPTHYDWTLSITSKSYNAQNQIDVVKGAVVVTPELSTSGYTVKVYTDQACATETETVTEIGSYWVKVFINNNAVGAAKEFRIGRYTVTITTADATKEYGSEDPKPNFTVDRNSETQIEQNGTEWLKIQNVLELERYDNKTNADDVKENVGAHDYVIKKTAAALADDFPYTIIVQNNTGILHITKAPLTIKVSKDYKTYGTADPTSYIWVKDPNNNNYKPFKYNDNEENVNITITRQAGEHIGFYNFICEAANYEVTAVNQFEIRKTNSTDGVTATFGDDEFVYRGTPWEPRPTITDANGPVQFNNVRYSTDHTNVGTVTVKVTLTGDYNNKEFETSFEITKKELRIIADNKPMLAGDADPVFTISYDGWVNEEGTSAGPDRTRIPQSAASTTNPVYFKTPSGVKKVNTDAAGVYDLEVIEDAASNNYKFKYVKGKLTFGTAILDIYAVDAEKTYGDKDPKFTLSLTVQQEGETLATPTDEKPITIGGVRQINPVRPGADTDEDAGTYRGAITFDKMPTVLAGYAVNYHKGDFTINKADLTITAKNQSKTYGQTDAEAELKFGYTLDAVNVTGNKNNEATEDILTGTWTYNAWGRQPQQHTNEVIIAVECVSQNNPHRENAGEYTITPRLRGQAGQANDFLKNYNLVFRTGKLTINKAALIIKPIPQTKQFGEDDPNFTQLAKVLEVTGLKRNDTKESVLGQISNPGLTVEREKPSTQQEPRQYENVGNYHITAYRQLPGGKSYSGEIANYTWTIQNKDGNADIDLVITPVQLIVKALDQSIDYGAEINGYKVKFFKPAVVVADAQPAAAAEVEVEMSEETIKKIINPLTPSTTKVGVNENGFQWNGFKDGNYAIAQVEVDGVKTDDFRNGYLTIYALQTIPLDEAELAKLELSAVKVIDEATGKDKDLLKKVLEDHKGLTVNVSLPGRKMDKDEWYAYVLPFEVTPRMLSKDNVWGYAAMETLDLNKSSEKSILFELQMFKVEPNTPFIVKIDKDLTAAQAKAIVLNNVTIDKEFDYLNETPASEGNGVSFVGQYESTVGFGANQMYLAKVKGYDHREFWRGGEKSASVAFVSTNACLEFTDANAAAGARVYIEEEDGTVTAIGGVESDATVDSEGWYNVSGIKLNAAPAQKGIFIKDGKKVLVK